MYKVHQLVVGVIVSAAGVCLLANSANAQFNRPGQAKSIKGNILTAYAPCTAPDTTTADGLPACSTPVRSDPTCGFGLLNGQPHGKGQVQVKTVPGRGWSVKLKLLGLEPACEGHQMTFRLSYRTTAKTCGGTFCTAADQTVTVSSCTVERSVCKINVPHGVPATNLLDINAEGTTELFDFHVLHNGVRAFDIGVVSAPLF
jgi:hypothetical protein